MNDSLTAASPHISACVLASAGTGKTWLLVARLVRLLMAGATPDRILAITFTRKAAAEMQVRLQEKLREFLDADDNMLDRLLSEIGEEASNENRIKARGLFETILFSEQPLRTTTFHSFCHDLLKRFPLEADLPPGFELIETTGLLFEQSWDALFASVTQHPTGEMADRLNRLFRYFASADSTQTALYSFLHHRSDWWAYTHDQSNPALYAEQKLADAMEICGDVDPAAQCLNTHLRTQLNRFAELLAKHPTKTNITHSGLILKSLALGDAISTLTMLTPAFIKMDGEPRLRKHSKALEGKLGDALAEFLSLHQEICDRLITYNDERAKIENFQANVDWYHCGYALLEQFQLIKRNRRLVDFTDLEWKAHQLLNHSEHAQWVHYKLDQRIDHLLIDEFQDTNPTQWQLLQPLINEISTDNPEEHRSLFIVGDAKQSIYRFRRGNPALLTIAADHMTQELNVKPFHMDASWRSSPVIMEAVNRIFTSSDLPGKLQDFSQHKTNLDKLWGQVEVWPIDNTVPPLPEISPDKDLEFRNPLMIPRIINTHNPYTAEAAQIADKIETLVKEKTVIGSPKQGKHISYHDIIILLRSRTHLADYEHALREKHIPYLSMDRGTLLKSLEVRDLESLLNLLMSPQNNLALAQVLRSPIFSASAADLTLLAQATNGSWIDQLELVSSSLDERQPLARANHLLSKWRELAGHIPIHDLLDQIYHDTNLIARYLAAFPKPLQPRVSSNLTSFIELALSIDSGRYPSLPHFLDRLRKLKKHSDDAPDEAPPESKTGQRVRIMTIHAAKGLEAPVVFLADCAKTDKKTKAYSTLVDWPAEATKPDMMMLTPGKKRSDSWNSKYLRKEQELEEKDSANLLYVAITRAKQMLFVSGSHSGKSPSTGWHGQISAALHDSDQDTDEIITLQHGTQSVLKEQKAPVKSEPVIIDRALSKPITLKKQDYEIAPSRQTLNEQYSTTGNGQRFGQAVHRLLQLKMENPGSAITAHSGQIVNELTLSQLVLDNVITQVETLLQEKSLYWIFYPANDSTAWNEAPIEYAMNGNMVTGFIDRLLMIDDQIHIIDYKSHQIENEQLIADLVSHYREQLNLYQKGVEKLWPGKLVKSWLLFTSIARLVEID